MFKSSTCLNTQTNLWDSVILSHRPPLPQPLLNVRRAFACWGAVASRYSRTCASPLPEHSTTFLSSLHWSYRVKAANHMTIIFYILKYVLNIEDLNVF